MTIRVWAIIIVLFTAPVSFALAEDFSHCRFQNLSVPDNALIYGAEINRGSTMLSQRLNGQQNLIRVAVNSPDHPVVLLLSAYEETVWHIGWTEGTKILAVAAIGHHPQKLIGLPAETEVLLSSFLGKNGVCPYPITRSFDGHRIYFDDQPEPQNLKKGNALNTVAQKLAGREVDRLFDLSPLGTLLMGLPINSGQPVFTDDKPSRNDVDPNWAAKHFFLTAIRQKRLKPATAQDYIKWITAKNQAAGLESDFITVPADLIAQNRAYLVLDPGIIEGLGDALSDVDVGKDEHFDVGRYDYFGFERDDQYVFYVPFYLESPPDNVNSLFLGLKDGTCLGPWCTKKFGDN